MQDNNEKFIQSAEILHQKASQWYEENNFKEKAISHALRSKNHLRVERLIKKYAMGMLHLSKYNIVLEWINTLPEEIIINSPWLCMYKAWTSHWAGLREGGAESLQHAENLVNESKTLSPEPVHDADPTQHSNNSPAGHKTKKTNQTLSNFRHSSDYQISMLASKTQ